MTDELKKALVNAILNTPPAQTQTGRDVLLDGITTLSLKRDPENALNDIRLMVSHLEESYDGNGRWRLLKLIDNAISSVPNTQLADELKRIRQEILSVERSRRITAAEAAQVYLFDLKETVLACIQQLPSGGVSGFVVPGATTTLLGYFCDSLKQRGTAIFWTRDRIAPKAPLYIDPLTMTGSLAAERAKKLGNELAVKHVLWPAYIRDQPEAEALWQAIQAAFAPPPKNHMIVVFGMPEALPVPAGMSRLPMPQFKCCDIADWLMDIATQRAWQESVVQRWIAFISMGETNGGPLPIDSVYDRLERCHKLLNRFPEDEEALLQELANQE